MAIKVQKEITEVIRGLLPFWLIRSLAIYPEVSKSNMCNFIFFKTRVICLNNLLLPLPWKKLFLHHRRLYFLPGYLGLPPFHQDFQKALCCLPGSQPLPPIFLLHGIQVAVHEVSVTRWQQCTAIIKIPDKKGSPWTKANQKQNPQILSKHSF